MKKRTMVTLLLSLFMVFSIIGTAFGSSLLFDRGLPTANLNNAAGASRSNVAWADWEASATPPQYWLPGDDFKIGTGGTYNIDKISVWSTNSSGLSLYGGQAGGTISQIGINPTVTSVQYADTTTYQGNSGAFRNVYQVDFALNWNITGGQTYQFFLDGPWNLYKTNPADGYVNPFLHASNAALSVSPQQGADNKFLFWEMNNGVPNPTGLVVWDSQFGGPAGWTPGWDKQSDGNVQVSGNQVPLPPSMLLLGSGLLGLVGLRWRRARKES